MSFSMVCNSGGLICNWAAATATAIVGGPFCSVGSAAFAVGYFAKGIFDAIQNRHNSKHLNNFKIALFCGLTTIPYAGQATGFLLCAAEKISPEVICENLPYMTYVAAIEVFLMGGITKV